VFKDVDESSYLTRKWSKSDTSVNLHRASNGDVPGGQPGLLDCMRATNRILRVSLVFRWLVYEEDVEHLVRDEQHSDSGLGDRPVFRDAPFGKPDEGARTVGALVSVQRSVEHVDAVSAIVIVPGSDKAWRIITVVDHHAGIWVAK